MRLEPTPQMQREHNDAVHRHLRVLGALAAVLIVSAIGLEAGLYFGLGSQVIVPKIIGPDGSVLGYAVVITPDYAITTVDAPPGSQLSVSGADPLPVQHARTANVRNITLLLLRLQVQYPKQIPQLRAVQAGESAKAITLSGRWEGTLSQSSESHSLEPQPGINIGDIASLLAKSDAALLGISVPAGKGDIAISVQDLLAKFPEMKK